MTEISEENLQDLLYIENGLFYPLKGFMGHDEFRAVVDEMKLLDGSTWSIPITLDVDELTYNEALKSRYLDIKYKKEIVAFMSITDGFKINIEDLEKVFCTKSLEHPGVKKEMERYPFRLGGKITLLKRELLENQLNPEKTREEFRKRNLKTVAGFQTRNAIHRAHEYLQRTALEVCDGLFINPIIGWKKKGDFTEEAVMAAYKKMVEDFYPQNRVYFEGLRTQMRYAGPREAIFHAIIRRNLGCTHFIIGRDHAGVGGFYELYAAHELARKIIARGDLGIELLLLHGPYYCNKCQQIVTGKTCCHSEHDRISISGTKIRKWFETGEAPDCRFMRQEVSTAILALGKDRIFIK